QRLERCLSAGLPPSSSSTSLTSGFPSSSSTSSSGLLSANPILSRKSSALKETSRIPVWNKSLHRPGLAPLVKVNGDEPKETLSAGVVPSARMATLNPRRAVSAFIQHDPVQLAPLSNAGSSTKPVSSRPVGGLAKGRVVSMLVTKSTFGDEEAASSDNDVTFDSPSAPRAVGAHRRMKSNGTVGIGRGPKSAFPTGSMRMRSPTQHYQKSATAFQPMQAVTDPSPFKPLLPFGDAEHFGKILPCHSVKQDGLMRITPDTMRSLLSGVYDSQMASYRIIDCRFGFEFEGGHIAGAVNLNNNDALEKFFFEDAIKNGTLPTPSQSGTPGLKQTVIIFHCEFSAKRGPTL
ncbi:6797_t:CDS:1, partial [Acaulospora colombiana]